MPPKPKYTRERIAAVALDIVKESGIDALTARELGRRLGMSSSPIFTIFENMEEVKQAAREIALREFIEYIGDYREWKPAFKRIGMMVVSYGMHKPELFKLLFMQEHARRSSLRDSINDLGEIAPVCVELIVSEYGIAPEQAQLIFEQMWTLAFGLGAMCAMRVCDLTEEEIGRRLGVSFYSLARYSTDPRATENYRVPVRAKDDPHSDLSVGEILNTQIHSER